MSGPLVSVIMPVHNAAPYLAAAVGSILGQRLGDLELIVVDDASTDGSAEIARGFSDPRVRFFRSEQPLNAAGARNLALAEARAEFVAFLDADDLAAPDRLDRQVAVLRRDPAVGVVASRMILIDERGDSGGVVFRAPPDDEIPGMLLFANCLALSSVTLRRALLEPFRPELAPAEDYDLWTRLAAKTRFVIGRRPLGRYRSYSLSVSMRQPDRMQAAVAAIHAAQLGELGFRDVPAAHGRIVAWPLNPTTGALAEAEAWLLALSASNDRRGRYAREPFRRVIAARWFAICFDSWQLGWPIWNIYHQSPLAAPTAARRLRLLRRLWAQPLREGRGR
jgi:glycosyltransferase involved in cell wall biosynthesis